MGSVSLSVKALAYRQRDYFRIGLGYQLLPIRASILVSESHKVRQTRVTSFYFGVIQAHEKVLDLQNKEALTVLEKLTHTTQSNPNPVMPLSKIQEDIPAMFRRAAIHAALGSARSFSSLLSKWRNRKEKATVKGKKWTSRSPVPLALRGCMQSISDQLLEWFQIPILKPFDTASDTNLRSSMHYLLLPMNTQ